HPRRRGRGRHDGGGPGREGDRGVGRGSRPVDAAGGPDGPAAGGDGAEVPVVRQPAAVRTGPLGNKGPGPGRGCGRLPRGRSTWGGASVAGSRGHFNSPPREPKTHFNSPQGNQ